MTTVKVRVGIYQTHGQVVQIECGRRSDHRSRYAGNYSTGNMIDTLQHFRRRMTPSIQL